MRLYYTTIVKENNPQNKPENSLGGYKSSTPVNNSFEGNLFSRISLNMIEKNKSEYIGLVLKNEFSVGVSNILLWTESNADAISRFEFSAVTMSNGLFENIPNRFSKPFLSDFYEAEGRQLALNLGELAAGQSIGLWVKRNLLIDVIKHQLEKQYLLDHIADEPNLIEEIAIKISFDQNYGDPIGSSNI